MPGKSFTPLPALSAISAVNKYHENIMKIAALVAVAFIAMALLCLVLKPEWLPFVLIGVVIAFGCVIVALVIPPVDEKKRWIEKAANDFLELLKLSGENAKRANEFKEMRKKLLDWGCIINDESVVRYNKKKSKRVKESEIFELKDEIDKTKKDIVKFKNMRSKCEKEKNTIIERMNRLKEVIPLLPYELEVVEISSNQERLDYISEKIKNWKVEHLDFDELSTFERVLCDVSEHLNKIYTYVEERKNNIKERADKLKDNVNHEEIRLKNALKRLIISAEEVRNNLEGARWCIENALKNLESLNLTKSERHLNVAEDKLASAKDKIEFLYGLVTVISRKRNEYPMTKSRLESLSDFLDHVIEEFNANHVEAKLKKGEGGIKIVHIEKYRHKEALIAMLTLIRRKIEGNILEEPKNTIHPTATEEVFGELKDLFINELGDSVIIEIREDKIFIDFRTEDVNEVVNDLVRKLRK